VPDASEPAGGMSVMVGEGATELRCCAWVRGEWVLSAGCFFLFSAACVCVPREPTLH
jgi:hypothetical protein